MSDKEIRKDGDKQHIPAQRLSHIRAVLDLDLARPATELRRYVSELLTEIDALKADVAAYAKVKSKPASVVHHVTDDGELGLLRQDVEFYSKRVVELEKELEKTKRDLDSADVVNGRLLRSVEDFGKENDELNRQAEVHLDNSNHWFGLYNQRGTELAKLRRRVQELEACYG